VPSQFFYEWLEEQYVDLLGQAIFRELGPRGMLDYSVIIDRGNEQNKPLSINFSASKSDRNTKAPVTMRNGSVGAAAQQSPFEIRNVIDNAYKHDSQLNPYYTFDSYIEGSCNNFARSAGWAVANKPGDTAFNPFMIYGGVGLGKTHLLHAIGNKIKKDHPQKFVLYVSSEKFTNQFLDALKNNNVQDFTNFYMQVDVLMLDDVQFLVGKDRTQDIFFHIFNHLHSLRKQIITTSDCAPKDLKGMHERLASRFKWGLTADLQQPDFETKIAIIQKKMQGDGIDLPFDVVEYLAASVDTNIRELEGILISLVAQTALNKKEFDIPLARHILQSMVHNIEKEIDIDFIQRSVSEFFDVSIDALKDKTRKKEIVVARQVAMYFAKEYTNYSLKTIGQHFGGRDHSTVIHAIQSVNDLIDTNRKFKTSIEELQKKLKVR
jgi:chromosomal replication initiator protein